MLLDKCYSRIVQIIPKLQKSVVLSSSLVVSLTAFTIYFLYNILSSLRTFILIINHRISVNQLSGLVQKVLNSVKGLFVYQQDDQHLFGTP